MSWPVLGLGWQHGKDFYWDQLSAEKHFQKVKRAFAPW
jgi:hypothetical protein